MIASIFTDQDIADGVRIGADYHMRRGQLFDYGQFDEIRIEAVAKFAGKPWTDKAMMELVDWLTRALIGSMDRAFYDI